MIRILSQFNSVEFTLFKLRNWPLDIPGELKAGYSPIGFVRCGRSACKMTTLKWKIGKETGRKKLESPHSLKSNEAAEIVLEPQQVI